MESRWYHNKVWVAVREFRAASGVGDYLFCVSHPPTSVGHGNCCIFIKIILKFNVLFVARGSRAPPAAPGTTSQGTLVTSFLIKRPQITYYGLLSDHSNLRIIVHIEV